MANRSSRADDDGLDHSDASPAVRCLECQFAWHSGVMAEGLRLLGSCPKCGGELAFAASEPAYRTGETGNMDLRAPHLVLGVPRR